MKEQNDFIEVNFELPNHTNQLNLAEEAIGKLKIKINSHNYHCPLSDNTFISLYEDVVKVLDYVGHLSNDAFNVQDDLEELYRKRYVHAPKLAKQLWLSHYEKIHHPYNILKNRCFRLLDDLDELYLRLYKKYPPNWKI
jgi:hypothetical protein